MELKLSLFTSLVDIVILFKKLFEGLIFWTMLSGSGLLDHQSGLPAGLNLVSILVS